MSLDCLFLTGLASSPGFASLCTVYRCWTALRAEMAFCAEMDVDRVNGSAALKVWRRRTRAVSGHILARGRQYASGKSPGPHVASWRNITPDCIFGGAEVRHRLPGRPTNRQGRKHVRGLPGNWSLGAQVVGAGAHKEQAGQRPWKTG